ERYLQLTKELSDPDPTNAGRKRSLAVSYSRLGDVMQAQGQLVEARRHYEKDLELTKALSEAEPTNAGLKWNLAISYNRLGYVAQEQGHLV
ncbi:tetratricopeptide repeat protein, partial [Archangium sp.]|uniref:tetratricopeptide repeat protein n=1 Tax=Archangium sp. TaxID=1872627 RepID=UPI002D222126